MAQGRSFLAESVLDHAVVLTAADAARSGRLTGVFRELADELLSPRGIGASCLQ